MDWRELFSENLIDAASEKLALLLFSSSWVSHDFPA